MKFLIADDHDIVRLGVKLLIRSKFSNSEIVEVTDFNRIANKIINEDFDLIILDVHMQDTCTTQFIKHLIYVKPKLKIIIFSYLKESVFGISYIKAGVKAYIHKKHDNTVLGYAIDKVLNNGIYLTEEINDQMRQILINDSGVFQKLSGREIEVLNYMLHGYTTSDISNRLHIHGTTVSTYKSRISEKLNTNNIMELKELAIIHGGFQ